MLQKTPEKQLLATGSLMKKGIAPMCGEVCGSYKDFNADQLSGMTLTPSFEEPVEQIMGGGTQLLTAVLYASKDKSYFEQGMRFDLEETWKDVDPKVVVANFLNLLRNPHDPTARAKLDKLPINILRLRMVDTNAATKMAKLKVELERYKNNSRTITLALQNLIMPISTFITSEELEESPPLFQLYLAVPINIQL